MGAVDFACDDSGVSFFRFTEEQREKYKERSDAYYRNSFSTAGIKLSFETDSKKLHLDILTEPGSSRRYFSLDVVANGERIGSIDNFSEREIPQNFHAMDGEFGEFSKSFELGSGIKTVCIHFPWSATTKLISMELDDGAFIKPAKKQKKLITFGDSITQGYDSLRPSSRYAARLSEALDAEEINKGIGGERFWPELSAMKDSFLPDYITVAYGTNDWRHYGLGPEAYDSFCGNCNLFFENLRKSYPDSKIFAITPLWRADIEKVEAAWTFEENEEIIRRAAESRGIEVIRGVELIPHRTDIFGDLVLHPNDDGFGFYFENLYNAVKNLI